MKVKIKPYPNWVGPFTLVEKLCFWIPKETDEYGFPRTAERVHNWGEWLAHTWFGNVWSKLASRWIDFHEKRRVRVHIDRWDTWSMDATLGYIILPMLKQLKETKHGSPFVDNEDVPHLPKYYSTSNERMQSDLFDSEEQDEFLWKQHEVRWNWVLDEMIYAFESLVGDNENWEDKYHTGTMDRIYVPIDADGNEVPEEDAKYFRWDKGPNDTSHFDAEGYKVEADRIQNGFRLFGKYYRGLWD